MNNQQVLTNGGYMPAANVSTGTYTIWPLNWPVNGTLKRTISVYEMPCYGCRERKECVDYDGQGIFLCKECATIEGKVW